MPIRPFLADHAFEPDVIATMSVALESVCGTLKLALVDDPATRRIAKKIIELAQRGVLDEATLIERTLKEMQEGV